MSDKLLEELRHQLDEANSNNRKAAELGLQLMQDKNVLENRLKSIFDDTSKEIDVSVFKKFKKFNEL